MPATASPLLRRLRRLFVSAPQAQPADLRGRRMLVTGATPGSLGFETARGLAAWGAAVTVTTRSDPAAALAALRQAVPGAQIEAQCLDLARADSVERFVDWYGARGLDVLVNNAGIHLDLLSQWKQPRLSDDGYEIQWRTNYLGTMHLTHRLLPQLCEGGRRSGDARVVNVVSQLHARGRNAALFAALQPYDSWAAYGTSKLALVHASFELQRRYAGSGLQAYCLHPGAVFTGIAARGLAGHRVVEALRSALRPVEAFFLLTPAEGAQTSLHCAAARGLEGGRYYRACRPAQPSAQADDAVISARLWEQTRAWVAAL